MQITQKKAEEAVQILLKWIGEDPNRPELVNVPAKVVARLAQRFEDADQDPLSVLKNSISAADPTYNKHGMIIFPDIAFDFFCEHSLTFTFGKLHIGYLPQNHITGINSLIRLVKLLCKKLQLQENLTMNIVKYFDMALQPYGCAVIAKANHFCANKKMIKTQAFSGEFKNDIMLRKEFLSLIKF